MTTAPRCHRCGEPLRPSQGTCGVCGTNIGIRAMPDEPKTNIGYDDGVSSMFLVPEVLHGPTLTIEERSASEQSRLLIWIAIGLSCVSIVGGMLYNLYYMRVGNAVTALLPRETVMYVRIGPVAHLQESFQNLEMWETTRPVRDRLAAQEQTLRRDFLLDFGITTRVLERLKAGLSQLHIAALIPEHQVAGTVPYDLLFFFEFEEASDREELLDAIEPWFEAAGEERGIPFYLRRLGVGALTLASFDELVVVGWGSDAAVREVLRTRERGPNRSLNDADGFRKAYRAGAHDRGSEVWAYLRHEHLVDLWTSRILAPILDDGQRRAIARHAKELREARVAGAGLSVDIRGGVDNGSLALHHQEPDGFADLVEWTGARPHRTLTSIPADAILTIAGTVEDPTALLNRWRGPLVQLLTDLGFFALTGTPGLGLNQLQAETGVYLTADIWPLLAREIAVAWVPTPGDISWLVVLRVNDTERALELVSRLSRHVLGSDPRIRLRLEHTGDDIYRLMTFRDQPDAEGAMGEVELGEALCWAAAGSNLLLAPDCDPVERALVAERLGSGLDVQATDALATLPDRSSVVALVSLRSALERLAGRRRLFELLRPDFLLGAALAIEPDRLELATNVSALSLGFLWAARINEPAGPEVSADACRQLASTVCQEVGSDSRTCREWRAKVKGSSPQACRTGLRTMRSFEQQPL